MFLGKLMKNKLTRRAFFKTGALAAAGLVAGCAALPIAETPTPSVLSAATATVAATATAISSATSTPQATATALPAATVAALPTAAPTVLPTFTVTATPLDVVPACADLIVHYPQTASSVVSIVTNSGVWEGDKILSDVVLEMLDATLVQLTGVNSALAAWQTLFDPGEVIGIKVNTISRYTTTPEVAYAVAQRLQEAGIPPEQIIIFDRTDRELAARGFTLSADGPGMRCRGAKAWEQSTGVSGSTQRIHDAMLSCDALINIPPIKQHGTSGFTSAMKNHYGTVRDPGALHGGDCDPYIAALNALPVIRDKTRLIVCDALRTCPYDWDHMVRENLIMMSFDPVANDTVARQVLLDRCQADGRKGTYILERSHYLDTAIKLGLGADAAHIEERRKSL
jgi:hypothetical protein